jgi:hypothetical protein
MAAAGLHMPAGIFNSSFSHQRRLRRVCKTLGSSVCRQQQAHPVLGNVNADRAKIRRNAVSSNGQIGGLKKTGPDLKIPLFFKIAPQKLSLK